MLRIKWKLRHGLIVSPIVAASIVFSGSTSFAVPTYGSKILITGSSPYANTIGEAIIEMGGNVVDVAVGVGTAMTVTNPYNASLGGGGFALIKFNSKVHALDFREMAPKKTNEKYYLDKGKLASRNGGKAIGVPGFAAGLIALHDKFGQLKWKDVVQPAVRLADRGFRVGGEWVHRTRNNRDRFNTAGRKFFFKNRQSEYKPGEFIKQKQLARALRLLRYSKSSGFYQGSVAEDIVSTANRAGGQLTLEDFNSYKVRWLKPIETTFLGYKLYLMPPPSSGGVVIKTALSLIEKLNLKSKKPLSVDELHILTEIQARSFRGRTLLGDPDFHKNPLDRVLSKNYLSTLAKSIRADKSTQLSPLKEQPTRTESKETTHFTVMDSKGNTVSLTVTLNGAYGSGVVSDRYGISLNNEMDDFTTRPGEPNMYGLIQGSGNYVQPGKRPLSSMSPTIITKGNQTVMALGAPGGPRIISSVLQVIYRTLGNNFDIDKAIQFPRVHHQFLPHSVYVLKDHLAPETLDGLRKRGHNVKESPWGARVNGIRRDPQTNILEAAFDSRAEGSVSGY